MPLGCSYCSDSPQLEAASGSNPPSVEAKQTLLVPNILTPVCPQVVQF